MGNTLNGGAIRDLSNPPAFGDPDHMSNYLWLPIEPRTDYGGVHTNSGIPNKAAYLLTAGGTFHNVVTSGIGYTRTEQIYYRAMKNYLTTYSDFAMTRAALYQSCRDLIGSFGIISGNCDQVLNAWAAVGVGSPAAIVPSGYKVYLPLVVGGSPPLSCSASGILANGNLRLERQTGRKRVAAASV
jgi:Zn-dependent metalloprotease